jgi:hypothetical protein
MQCGKALGARIIQLGIQAFNPHAFDDVMSRFGGRYPEFTPDVIQHLNDYADRLMNLGTELTWLSQVLPAAAQGDWGPYLNNPTIFRQNVRLGIVYINSLSQMNPALVDFAIRANASEADAFVEQETVMLALTHVGG